MTVPTSGDLITVEWRHRTRNDDPIYSSGNLLALHEAGLWWTLDGQPERPIFAPWRDIAAIYGGRFP